MANSLLLMESLFPVCAFTSLIPAAGSHMFSLLLIPTLIYHHSFFASTISLSNSLTHSVTSAPFGAIF